MTDVEREKRLAAEVAAHLVAPGMRVGLGTGSTVAYLLPALARRAIAICCVATSPATAAAAQALGLVVETFSGATLDIAVDGADQIDSQGWLVKGGGGAHTREKIVAAASDRFVVIASSNKLVEALHPPVPLELVPFGVHATTAALGGPGNVVVRDAAPSPDGGVIADYLGDVGTPATVAGLLCATPGVVEHGLFPPSMVSEIVVCIGEEVHRRVVTAWAPAS